MSIIQASGVYRPLISTVIAPDSDGCLEESLDRHKYRASEMPQGFHYSVISTAYQKVSIVSIWIFFHFIFSVFKSDY